MAAYYLPWNPLSLSADIDSGLHVDRGKVQIPLYSQGFSKFVWSAVFHPNLVMFKHDDGDVVELCRNVSNYLSQREVGHSGIARLYDFHDLYEAVDTFENADFARIPYKASFEQFLQDFVKLRSQVLEATHKAHFMEPGNKRIQILIIPIGADELRLFQTSQSIQKAFMDVLRNSKNARIFPWFVMDRAEIFSAQLCRIFSVAIYLGEENAQYAHEVVYPNLPLGKYGTMREVVGVAVRKDNDKVLFRLHHLGRKNSSEWAKMVREYNKKEEAAYRAFLDSLED